jgi:V-type H+-transporting ATPase subunit d
MIDNVMLVLKATLNNPNVNIKDLMDQVHPLGTLPQEAMKMIAKFDNTPEKYAELYHAVLINTPVGKYFEQFLSEALASEGENSGGGGGDANLTSTGDVRNFMEEDGTTKLENTIRKFYLEDFYNYCSNIGGDTGTIMCELLLARADAIAISITLNSFGTSLNDESMEATRQSLYPGIGYLYPGATGKGGSLTKSHDEESLGEALKNYSEYAEVLARFVQGETTMDDAFYARETMLCELAFEGQFNFACFYAYVRLKEQEIRNLVWCCETIIQKQKSKMGQHYIPIFSRNSPWRTSKTESV